MSEHAQLQNKITELFSTDGVDLNAPENQEAIHSVINLLDKGELRVCEKVNNEWQVNSWVKQAILLFFRTAKLGPVKCEDLSFYDKVPLKQWDGSEGVRVVPHALARKGSFIAKGTILMPSYVNIGAFVDSGSMVDTWATVGSCAQVGKNVHLSGGVGLGGVLEPLQATPVIVEDNCFIGSRCIIVEGAIIEEGAVIGAGVTITASTKIIDVTESKPTIYKGRVPKNSVVIPGTINKNFAAGEFGVPAALIIGKRSESTDKKTSLNSALREFEVSV